MFLRVGPCFDGNHLSGLLGILEIAASVIGPIPGKLEHRMFTLEYVRHDRSLCGTVTSLFSFYPPPQIA